MGIIGLFRGILSARELLFVLIEKELKARYKQSLLGPMWSFLRPLLLMCLFIMLQVITGIKTDGVPYSVLVYTALLPWSFLANAITIATDSITSNASIIKKLSCPRYIFPLVAIGTCLVDLLIATIPLVIMLIYYRIGIGLYLLYLPLFIIIQSIFVIGVSLVTSSVTVYKRDILMSMPFIMQFWMFASPVMYPLKSVPDKWRSLYDINPMVGIIESYRSVILYNEPPCFSLLLIDGLVALVFLSIGIVTFRQLERNFADEI